eukprot:5483370-Karenia_brevis.AAC.1
MCIRDSFQGLLEVARRAQSSATANQPSVLQMLGAMPQSHSSGAGNLNVVGNISGNAAEEAMRPSVPVFREAEPAPTTS